MIPLTPSPNISLHPRPTSCRDLFWSFSKLGLQGFGGVLAIVQRELVEKKQWMSRDEFVEDWAVAQVMPGPNVVNLSMMIGGRYFGLKGALSALSGILCFPLVIVLILISAFAFVADLPQIQGALRGMGAVAAALIAATGFKLMGALGKNPMGQVACLGWAAMAFAAVALLRWPLASVIAVLGLPACCMAAWAIQRTDRKKREPKA